MADSWRVCMICTIRPIAHVLAGALRERGHEPVALVAPRPAAGADEPPRAAAAHAVERTRRRRSALRQGQVVDRAAAPCLRARPRRCAGASRGRSRRRRSTSPRLGSINQHPALLRAIAARSRSPGRCARGDADWGFTWHRMDAELDTGNILSQGSLPIRDDDCDIAEFGPRLLEEAVGLLPQALDRVAAGDPGDPQPDEGATWAGHFEDDDYVRVDWSQPARRIHDQVRAWHLTFGHSKLRAPGRGARRRGGRAAADEARRPRQRGPPGRVRRRPDLDRGGRARTPRVGAGWRP